MGMQTAQEKPGLWQTYRPDAVAEDSMERVETKLCLQRAPETHFLWGQELALASNHLLLPSLHPLLPFSPAKPCTGMPLPCWPALQGHLPVLACSAVRAQQCGPCRRAISRGCVLQRCEKRCWHCCSELTKIGLVTLNTLDNKSSL